MTIDEPDRPGTGKRKLYSHPIYSKFNKTSLKRREMKEGEKIPPLP